MVYIIIMAASEVYPVAAIGTTLLLLGTFAYMTYRKISLKGSDIGLMVLLSFSFPGMGLVYIGATKEGLSWFVIQLGGFLLSYLMTQMGVEGRGPSLAIMLPFLFQLLYCAKAHRERYGVRTKI